MRELRLIEIRQFSKVTQLVSIQTQDLKPDTNNYKEKKKCSFTYTAKDFKLLILSYIWYPFGENHLS